MLPILYEDADIVAVNKPAGVLTHADGRTQSAGGEPTAEESFKETYPDVTLDRPYVHRLDRDTSGVLIFAKTQTAHDFLRRAFTNREVEKTYLAFVHGTLKEKKGVIDFDIGRSRKDFRLKSAQPKAKGRLREALTHYAVLGETNGVSLLKVSPKTGRTHQIRVHLKAIHHPVVGDSLYAPGHPEVLGIKRLGLHAYSITVPLYSGKSIEIVAPVPRDFATALAYFSNLPEQFAESTDA